MAIVPSPQFGTLVIHGKHLRVKELPSFAYVRAKPSIESQGLFRIRRNASQWDNQDRERGNRQRAGPENLSNLCGCSMMERWREGMGTEGNEFGWDGEKWRFNLKTKNCTAPETYTITTVSRDDSEFVVAPTCVAVFVIEAK
jgi:hypothetical protein